jgi:hypothetical protein
LLGYSGRKPADNALPIFLVLGHWHAVGKKPARLLQTDGEKPLHFTVSRLSLPKFP